MRRFALRDTVCGCKGRTARDSRRCPPRCPGPTRPTPHRARSLQPPACAGMPGGTVGPTAPGAVSAEPARSLDAQFLDPVAQGAKAHSEYLGCCGLVVARLFQRLDDGVALHVLQLCSQRGRAAEV